MPKLISSLVIFILFTFREIRTSMSRVNQHFEPNSNNFISFTQFKTNKILAVAETKLHLYTLGSPGVDHTENLDPISPTCVQEISGTDGFIIGDKTKDIKIYSLSDAFALTEISTISLVTGDFQPPAVTPTVLVIQPIPNSNFYLAQYQPEKIVKFDLNNPANPTLSDSKCADNIAKMGIFKSKSIVLYQALRKPEVYSFDYSKGEFLKLLDIPVLYNGNFFTNFVQVVDWHHEVEAVVVYSQVYLSFFIYDFMKDKAVSVFPIKDGFSGDDQMNMIHIPGTSLIAIHSIEGFKYFDILDKNPLTGKGQADTSYSNFISAYQVDWFNNQFFGMRGPTIEVYAINDPKICEYPCETCSTTPQTCDTCSLGYTLSGSTCSKTCSGSQVFIDGVGCTGSCNSEQFKTKDGICYDCPTNCASCYSLFEGTCLSCKSGFVLTVEGSCESSCPSGQYKDGSTCKKCGPFCESCSSSESCSKCITGFEFSTNATQCVRPCGSYLYFDKKTEICEKCAIGCYLCNEIDDCYQCETGLYVNFGECVIECPARRTLQKELAQCVDCADHCLKCSLETDAEDGSVCSVCEDGYLLYEGKCMLTCPVGLYKDELTQICNDCDDNCKECDKDECFECFDGYYLNILGKCQAEHPFIIKSLRFVFIGGIALIIYLGWLYKKLVVKHLLKLKKGKVDEDKIEEIKNYFLKRNI